MNFDLDFIIDSLIKIFASVVCGSLLGLERKHRYQVMGMRTLVLISVSSTLLSILSYLLTEIQVQKGFDGGDPTRIIAGVVSGIGFLGGGTIIHQGMNIRGLSSAAVVWTASALGLAIGAGLYLQSGVVIVIALIMLVYLDKFEEKLFPGGKNKKVHMVYQDNDDVDLSKVRLCLEKEGFRVMDVNISRIMASHQLILHYTVKAPNADEFNSVISELDKIGQLEEFSMTD